MPSGYEPVERLIGNMRVRLLPWGPIIMDLDYHIPKTLDEVIDLLNRRIEVHIKWRDFCLEGSPEAKSCEKHGVGTAESHQRYINQYQASISILESLL